MEDSIFKKIDGLKWLPWIGSEYTQQPFKLLIVGESHYAENERFKAFDNDGMTRECVRDMGENDNAYRVKFYQNIHKILAKPGDFDPKTFWSNVTFYNFVQKTIPISKKRPDFCDFQRSVHPFYELLEIIRPDICLMCGIASLNLIKDNVSKYNFSETNFERLGKISRTYPRILTIKSEKGNFINLIFIQHPSHHFSYNKWGIFLRQQLPSDIIDTYKNTTKK